MHLPNSYTLKPNSIPEYFDAIIQAQAPKRFSQKFLEDIGFKSTNDRLFIGILKELKFLDSDGSPTERYFEYLDRSQSQRVLADGIRDMYEGLFAVNVDAHKLTIDEVKNKLRTLYKGTKTDTLIDRVARTFTALVPEADFDSPQASQVLKIDAACETASDDTIDGEYVVKDTTPKSDNATTQNRPVTSRFDAVAGSLASLQYHINIVLPESRDPQVYDALFRSLREHLG